MNDPMPSGVFRFLPIDRVAFGAAAVRQLPGELDRRGLQRAMVITGETVANRTNLLWYIEQLLGPRHAATYTSARQHVPSATVAEAVDLARESGADCLVSLGGGSPIDTTKAVAHTLAFGESAPADLGVAPGGRRDGPAPPPHFAVPTTLSAGEFTHVAGVTDEESRIKGAVGEPRLAPCVVFLDPQMTIATPGPLWLSTGIKALDHAVECFLSPHHQPVTDALALEAVRLLFTYLPRSAADPADLAPRMQCQIAAWMSLFSPASVRGGLSHALGHQIGARCDVPHGVTSCITLAPVMRFLAPVSAARQALLAHAMSMDGDQGGSAAPTVAAADAVAALVRRLDLPATLRDAGVDERAIDGIARAAYHEAATRPTLRPITDLAELTALLHSMW